MFKKTALTLLASLGLLTANMTPAMAERFEDYTTFTPSQCGINLDGEIFECDEVIIGLLANGTSNIKVCFSDGCLILIVSRSQLVNMANSRDFYVQEIALQERSSITDQWDVDMICDMTTYNGMACAGKIENRIPIAIYFR